MSRRLLFLALAFALLRPGAVAQDESHADDGPPISITSPDTGTTYAFGTIKTHSLYWDKNQKILIARVTFVDENTDSATQSSDTHEFRVPGITFDGAKGIFTATTAKGDVIPVAHIKKVLFVKTIETTPNAAVRVLHPRGNITVILEAISPDDPAMHPAPTDPNGTHQVDIHQIVN
jgi:hypothetical protein